jgi:bis(5'-nucleosidyl)-tetraphosphatase
MTFEPKIKHEKSCGAVVFCRFPDGLKVLLLKHRVGHWDFPKGHVKLNETEAETALREVKEESGLTVALDLNFRETINYSPKDKVSKDVVYFLGHCDEQEVKNLAPQQSEIAAAKFVLLDQAENMFTFASGKEVFRKALIYMNAIPSFSN